MNKYVKEEMDLMDDEDDEEDSIEADDYNDCINIFT